MKAEDLGTITWDKVGANYKPNGMDEDSTALPHTISRVDMPESVLDGRVGEICQQCFGNYPLAYAWGSLVTTAGTLVPRNGEPLRTNLFWAPVGPTDSGKSATQEAAFQALGMSPQNELLIEGKFGSAEGLIERLGDVEPGARRFIWVDELAHLLSKAAIDRASFVHILNTAYYRDQQSGGSKGKQFNLDCRLTIAGGLVEDLFDRSFGAATTGGLYDRFVFGLCPQPHRFLWRPFEEKPVKLNPFPASVNREVWDVRDEWIKNENIAPRVAEHSLRIAYICACADGRPELRGNQLEPALAFAKYQMRVRGVLAPNPGENPDAQCAVAIRNWLTEHAGNGEDVKRRDLDRGIHSNRYGPGLFNRCLTNLFFNGEIEMADDGRIVRLLL